MGDLTDVENRCPATKTVRLPHLEMKLRCDARGTHQGRHKQDGALGPGTVVYFDTTK